MRIPKQVQAAAELEELALAIPEVIRLLREGQSPELAYALVYELRWRMGKIVSDLGALQSRINSRRDAKDIIDAQIWSA